MASEQYQQQCHSHIWTLSLMYMWMYYIDIFNGIAKIKAEIFHACKTLDIMAGQETPMVQKIRMYGPRNVSRNTAHSWLPTSNLISVHASLGYLWIFNARTSDLHLISISNDLFIWRRIGQPISISRFHLTHAFNQNKNTADKNVISHGTLIRPITIKATSTKARNRVRTFSRAHQCECVRACVCVRPEVNKLQKDTTKQSNMKRIRICGLMKGQRNQTSTYYTKRNASCCLM